MLGSPMALVFKSPAGFVWKQPSVTRSACRMEVIHLGSKGHLNAKEFATRCAVLAIKTSVPIGLRAAASIHKDPNHVQALRDAANRCETEGSRQSALDAREVARSARRDADAASAAYAAAATGAAAYAAAAYAAA